MSQLVELTIPHLYESISRGGGQPPGRYIKGPYMPMTITNLISKIDDINEIATQFDRFARFYDADYRDYDEDIQLLVDLAHEYEGPIVEFGCGTGRALLPLAASGYTVHGVDISQALLTIAEKKVNAANATAQISLFRGDIRNCTLPSTQYAFAFCVSNTLMHCESQEDQLSVLQVAYDHLQPGGALLVDLFNPDIIALNEVSGMAELADSWVDEKGHQFMKWSIRTVDIGSQLQNTIFIYEEIEPNGQSQRNVCPFTLRFLWPSEGKLMLERIGFQVLAIWGDFYGNEYESQSERLIYLAKKP